MTDSGSVFEGGKISSVIIALLIVSSSMVAFVSLSSQPVEASSIDDPILQGGGGNQTDDFTAYDRQDHGSVYTYSGSGDEADGIAHPSVKKLPSGEYIWVYTGDVDHLRIDTAATRTGLGEGTTIANSSDTGSDRLMGSDFAIYDNTLYLIARYHDGTGPDGIVLFTTPLDGNYKSPGDWTYHGEIIPETYDQFSNVNDPQLQMYDTKTDGHKFWLQMWGDGKDGNGYYVLSSDDKNLSQSSWNVENNGHSILDVDESSKAWPGDIYYNRSQDKWVFAYAKRDGETTRTNTYLAYSDSINSNFTDTEQVILPADLNESVAYDDSWVIEGDWLVENGRMYFYYAADPDTGLKTDIALASYSQDQILAEYDNPKVWKRSDMNENHFHREDGVLQSALFNNDEDWSGKADAYSAPRMYANPHGNWTFTTKLNVTNLADGSHAGIAMFEGKGNGTVHMFGRFRSDTQGANGFRHASFTGSTYTKNKTNSQTDNTVWLRAKRWTNGTKNFQIKYSDGGTWETFDTTERMTDPNVGVFGKAFGSGSGLEFQYEYARLETPSYTANLVSGRVTYCPTANPGCESPSPVPNGTVVEAWGVKENNIDPGRAQSLSERAEEIRNDIRNFDAEKIGWDPNRKLTGSGGDFENIDQKYVAVHNPDDWGLEAWSDSPQLEDPLLTAPADRDFILSVWDPTSNTRIQDGLDKDLPGTVHDDTKIVLEQLDYQSGVVNTYTVPTDSTYESADWSFASDHDYARVNLPPGFYRVHAKGSSFSYVITVGDPQDLSQTITSDLRTDADKLSQQAEKARDLMNQNKVVKLTNTTFTENGTSGKFEFSSVPDDVHVVAIQAYTPAANGYQLDDPANASIQDLREVAALSSYNGSFYVTPRAKDVIAPSAGNGVKALEVSATPFMDPARFQNKTEWLEQLFTNETFADSVATHLEMNTTEREDLLSELETIKEDNSELEQRYQELVDSVADNPDSPTTDEEIQALEQAIRDLEGKLQADEPEVGFSEGTVSATVPFNGNGVTGASSLDPDAVSVVAHFPNSGNSETVPDEYVSVNSNIGRSDTVEITDYPVPNTDHMVTFSVTVSGEDGGLGTAKVPAISPQFGGTPLELKSVTVSSLYPGPSETVTVTPVAGEESATIKSVNATVSGPNGKVPTNQVDTGEVNFQTDGKGAYYVTLDITGEDGNTWTESLSVKANAESVSEPATLRVREGFTGTFPVIGQSLVGGSVDEQSDSVGVTAIADSENIPSSVHVHMEELTGSVTDTEFRLMKKSGNSGPETARKHIKVYMHTDTLPEDAVVYRNGNQPLKVGGSTAYGDIRCSEDGQGCTVITHTDGDGTATVTVNSNPDLIDRAMYWARSNIPINIPDVPGIGMIVPTPDIPAAMTSVQVSVSAPVSNLADTASTVTASPDTGAVSSGVVA